MELKDLEEFTRRAANRKSVRTATVGICAAALAGAAAGFALAVRLGKHRREIESGCRPAASHAKKSPETAPDETAEPTAE